MTSEDTGRALSTSGDPVVAVEDEGLRALQDGGVDAVAGGMVHPLAGQFNSLADGHRQMSAPKV
jgi:hypothetical protein